MLSALMTVSMRWAIIKTNGIFNFVIEFKTYCSVRRSSADVPSSSINISGFLIRALAIAIRCFWPPLREEY